jgi:hypothetical protein
MVEQRHQLEECNQAGEDDAPDSQNWNRKEERRKELQHPPWPDKTDVDIRVATSVGAAGKS